MKAIKFLIFLSFVMIANFSLAQSKMQAAKTPVKEKAKIDEGEMKTYIMVFLKKGPNRTHPKEEAAKIQEGHMAHLTKMHQEGILLMAGPFMDDEDIKGPIVFLASDALGYNTGNNLLSGGGPRVKKQTKVEKKKNTN